MIKTGEIVWHWPDNSFPSHSFLQMDTSKNLAIETAFWFTSPGDFARRRWIRGQAGFWDIDERYVRLSEAGDPLGKLNAVVPWEVFRNPMAKALKRSDGAKGGWPPCDAVMMFKITVMQALS
ncbi:hypothetical protein NKH60_33305 [Mesorhizobium sp. M1006]|uniref:hypothetical protein n=1 Tax=Mesorhizobium sp. M1006 TaxID=2957048 RepID=UPI00333A07CC